jgi:hypothetical protein
MNTFSLILIACAVGAGGEPDCNAGRRVDVPDFVWPTPIGCIVASSQLAASWSAGNPGWRPVELRCVPTMRLPAELAELEGENV